jgi:hypothetical protein
MGLLRRIFIGDGHFPPDLRAHLESEGFVLVEEDLPGSITFRNYRAPRQRSSFEKVATGGSIAITRRRIVIFLAGGRTGLRGKHMDVPLDDPRIRTVEVTADGPEKVCVAYDPSKFNPATSGRVEVRLKTPRAGEIVAIMNR